MNKNKNMNVIVNRGSLRLRLLMLCWVAGLFACASVDQPPKANPASAGPSVELLDLGDKLFSQSKYEDARRMYARAVRANGPDHAYVEACAQVARMESLCGKPEDGRPWLTLASRRASREVPLGWSRFQMVVGIFEREAGSTEAAVQRFKALYQYCLEEGLYERAIDVAHHVVLATDDIEEQMLWSKKGIDAAEAGGLQGWLAVLWNNKGAALEAEGRFDDALTAYTRARKYHVQTGNKRRILIANWALARALRLTGDLAAARDLSEETLDQARRRYDADPIPDNAEWVGYCTWEIGELDALDGDGLGAIAGLTQARECLVRAGIRSWGDFGSEELAKLDGRLAELEAGSE
jgi:tetratricopeptide (TPR) repeat protein